MKMKFYLNPTLMMALFTFTLAIPAYAADPIMVPKTNITIAPKATVNKNINQKIIKPVAEKKIHIKSVTTSPNTSSSQQEKHSKQGPWNWEVVVTDIDPVLSSKKTYELELTQERENDSYTTTCPVAQVKLSDNVVKMLRTMTYTGQWHNIMAQRMSVKLYEKNSLNSRELVDTMVVDVPRISADIIALDYNADTKNIHMEIKNTSGFPVRFGFTLANANSEDTYGIENTSTPLLQPNGIFSLDKTYTFASRPMENLKLRVYYDTVVCNKTNPYSVPVTAMTKEY